MGQGDLSFDAVVIGGGFYGAAIAVYLARQRSLARVLLVERTSALLSKASYNNQARVHNGYHYPRSFTTAYRSRINFPRFVRDFPEATTQNFRMIYGIARRNSKVTARQFERFCRAIGARIEPVHSTLRALFDPRLIEEAFVVEEFAFDATKLAGWAEDSLKDAGATVWRNTRVEAVTRGPQGRLHVAFESRDRRSAVECRYVFNCTYSALNQLAGDVPPTRTKLKQEIAEIALVHAPAALEGLGITVIDGPFFSMMPFPARGLHTLSHVRYTPHTHWQDGAQIDPQATLDRYHRLSRADWMIRDAARYAPPIAGVSHVDALFEVKTVLVKNEGDDGRPILVEKYSELPGYFSVLGGKIDNVYDVLEKLDVEVFEPGPAKEAMNA